MKQALKIITLSALTTAALIKGVPALAEPVGENIAIVPTADLDLSTQHGQSRLEVRLARAAEQVCGTASNLDPAGANKVRQCRAAVLTSAHEKSRVLIAAGSTPRTILMSAR